MYPIRGWNQFHRLAQLCWHQKSQPPRYDILGMRWHRLFIKMNPGLWRSPVRWALIESQSSCVLSQGTSWLQGFHMSEGDTDPLIRNYCTHDISQIVGLAIRPQVHCHRRQALQDAPIWVKKCNCTLGRVMPWCILRDSWHMSKLYGDMTKYLA